MRGRTAIYNELVRGIAGDHGALLVDYWRFNEYYDWGMWAKDRMHMSAAGHANMAKRVLTVLEHDHSIEVPPMTPVPGAQQGGSASGERPLGPGVRRALGGPARHRQILRRRPPAEVRPAHPALEAPPHRSTRCPVRWSSGRPKLPPEPARRQAVRRPLRTASTSMSHMRGGAVEHGNAAGHDRRCQDIGRDHVRSGDGNLPEFRGAGRDAPDVVAAFSGTGGRQRRLGPAVGRLCRQRTQRPPRPAGIRRAGSSGPPDRSPPARAHRCRDRGSR